ncbi:unnamed protein product [Lasius platythorax]|uniref:Uncharacterized protein n=1 Tax=Lasius platythorax TaxID=488582 RepID=A0AAV2NKT0_9HYME
MGFRNMFVPCRECDDMFHWREHSHLCRVCRRAPVVGRELPTDPFWRACAAIFRCSNTPYSLRVMLDVFSGMREVYEVVPVPRKLAWRIPFQSVERALEGPRGTTAVPFLWRGAGGSPRCGGEHAA